MIENATNTTSSSTGSGLISRPGLDEKILSASTEITPRKYVLRASDYIRNNQQDTAISMLEAGRKAHPEDTFIISLLGTLYHRTGRYEDVIITLSDGIHLDPDDLYMHYGLGVAQYEIGNHNEAEHHIRTAIALDPINMQSHSALVNLLLDQNRFGDAKAQIGEAVSHIGRSNGLLYRAQARIFARQNDFKQSEAVLHRSLMINPAYSAAMGDLGIVMAIQREWEIAQYLLQGAIESNGMPDAKYNATRFKAALSTARKGPSSPDRCVMLERHFLIHENTSVPGFPG